jgi:hypothetical protein
MSCHRCGKTFETAGRIGRSDCCAACGAPLRACRNCRFYSETAHHQCRETEAEYVSDKESANVCDCFEPAADGPAPAGGGNAATRAAEAREKLDRLFRK